MGTKVDDYRRNHRRNDNQELQNSIAKARQLIFERGYDVAGEPIKELLGSTSQLPIQVCHSVS
jgi:hypothetical protein